MYRILILLLLIVSCAQPFRKPPTFLTKRVKMVKVADSTIEFKGFDTTSYCAYVRVTDQCIPFDHFNPIIEHSEIKDTVPLTITHPLARGTDIEWTDPQALRFIDPVTGRLYDSVPQCKHIWTQVFQADSIVCVKCYKQRHINGGGGGGGLLSLTDTATYYMHIDTTSGRITFDTLVPSHPILPYDVKSN